MEIATAVRRGRLTLSMPFGQWLADLRALPELQFEPVTAEIAALAGSFDGAMHGDPADRIIAATARGGRAKPYTPISSRLNTRSASHTSATIRARTEPPTNTPLRYSGVFRNR